MKNFVVYKSSAGSGKTFTLVLAYLKLCLQEEKTLKFQFKKILAITFTNKAAAEMKSRVIKALDEICKRNDLGAIGAILQNDLKLEKLELKHRAQIVLSQILHHYSDFSIGTIDSFTHRLVKTFAFDLKLPNNFNIEMDTASFHNKVIALLLNKIGEDDYISMLLKEFAKLNAENNHAWDPEQQLKEFTALLLQENASLFIDKLNQFNHEELDGFRKQFSAFIQHYEKQLKTEAEQALHYINAKGLLESDFIYTKSGPQNFFKKCANLTATIDDTMGSRLTDAVQNNNWFGKNKTPQDASIIEKLSQMANQLILFIEENYQAYLLCKLLAKQMYALLLLKKIEEISRALKDEEHVVFLSEFNQKISEIIANEPTPFIYERLGEKYNHYLIDEFQDTSSLQWHNLIPLIDNSLAGGWRNLLVGDGKQSIYRWRNANVMQFANLPELENKNNNLLTAQYQRNLSNNYEQQNLNTNFRSSQEVINFNNRFFEFTANKALSADFQKIYSQHQQLTKHSAQGYVRIDFLHEKKEDKENFYLDKMLAHIQDAVQKNYQYEDICVLVRKNQHGSLVAQHLALSGIPVISSDSLLLKNNLEVNTLMAYLEYQIDSNNSISAAAILHYFWVDKKLNQQQYHHCLAELGAKKNLANILQELKIEFTPQNFNLNNVFDTCLEAIQLLGMEQKASAYIRFFLDEVSNFLSQHNASVSKFIEWWEKRREKSSLIIPKGSRAVNVMTVHSSKGLEFPIVIVPFCDWGLNQGTDKWVNVESDKTPLPVAVINLSQNASKAGFDKEVELENQEQILDNLNILYVAFTRAVNKLFILSASPRQNQGSAYHWLCDYVQQNDPKQQTTFYEQGSNDVKSESKATTINSDYVLNALQFQNKQNAVRIKSSYLGNTSLMEAGKKGILLHQLLSGVQHVNDLEPTLAQALVKGLIQSNEISALKEQLLGIVEHPDLKDYFEQNARQVLEREIILPNGEILRPDKVVLKNNETIVIDYKTGKKNLKSHQAQIIKYAEALQGMGYPSLKKILVYLDDMEIVAVN